MVRFAAIVATLCLVSALTGRSTEAVTVNSQVPRSAAEQKAIDLCSTCHGPRGMSTSPEFPILAAQQPEYLKAQLDAFRSHTRGEKDAHDFMWGIASGLDDALIAGLAEYYAAQPAPPGHAGPPTLVAQGKQLYDNGSSDRAIPACASCHGTDGAGRSGIFPRLAGQHAKYVAKQLRYIQSLTRHAPVMHGIVSNLTPLDIEAVSAYVQSL